MMSFSYKPIKFLTVVIAALILGFAVPSTFPSTQPEDATDAIANTFDRYPIVALTENAHAVDQFHAFYRSLVTNPKFLAKANDVVIEFGNSVYQPILDRYILDGEDVPFAELSKVWRSCPHSFAWEGPVYPEFLKTVHEMNLKLPKNRRLRVLGGDAPIDWAKIHTHDEWQPYNEDRDPSFARVIDAQVLRKGRKALVIMGANHLTKSGDRDGGPDTTTLVEAKHPGSVYVIEVWAKDDPRMAGWKPQSFFPVTGTWLSNMPQKVDADAIIYIGPSNSFTMTYSQIQWNGYDSAYLNELDRRHQIVFGCSFDLEQRKIGPNPYKNWPCATGSPNKATGQK